MRSIVTLVGTGLAVTLALAGCSVPTSSPAGGQGEGGQGEVDQIVLADGGDPGEFNPVSGYGSTGVSPLYEGLLRPAAEDDSTLPRLEPALAAEEPEVSADGLTWTVRLRDEVRFHDGSQLDSGDVAATYRAVVDPRSASPIASDYSTIERVETPDALTVRFQLRAPDPGMPARLLLGIVPSEALTPGPASASVLNSAPVGTGPYRLDRLTAAEAVLEAFPEHRDGPPEVSRLVLRSVPDADARAQMVMAGEVDGASLPPRLAEGLADRDGLELVSVSSADWRAVALPMSHPFAGDPAARRALNVAVDRDGLVDRVLSGYGRPVASPISDAYPEYESSPFTEARDAGERTAEATEILREAGWRPGDDDVLVRDGERAEFTLAYPATDPVRRELASAFADQLRDLGVAVTVWGGSWDQIEQRIGEVAILLGGGDNPYTVDTQAYRALHSRTAATGPLDNPGDFSDPRVDAALDAARTTADPVERTEFYREAQRAYARAPGHVFLATLDHTYVLRETGHTRPAPILEPHTHGVTWGPWWSLASWTRDR
ncbi:transporter [Dietzia sp. UCD-THP]|uniref:ABC transporter substrate-binding protein n=1 Tax=Dietzia sp. UCD-THP TaxID=1292020 RepID=UPI00037F8846|nr:ABC transporter substrate-binding protein [Dietzia sp. UCD-THP]EYT58614.1 transporter [Dietzia sp. UCD-THP]